MKKNCCVILLYVLVVMARVEVLPPNDGFFDPDVNIDTSSLILVKHNLVLGMSTEGADFRVYVEPETNDSILVASFYGETGKWLYKFIFNKKLKVAERITHRYALPIMADFGPDVNVIPGRETITKETLDTSEEAKKRLTEDFFEFKRIILNE